MIASMVIGLLVGVGVVFLAVLCYFLFAIFRLLQTIRSINLEIHNLVKVTKKTILPEVKQQPIWGEMVTAIDQGTKAAAKKARVHRRTEEEEAELEKPFGERML